VTGAAAGREPAIAVEDLVKRYGTRTVVECLSLAVHPGEIVALLGPNGAGKTTTVEIIEGYRRNDGGRVQVLGDEAARGRRELRARVGLMLQSGGFDLRARPRETLEQYAAFHLDPRNPDELLGLLGLADVARTPYRRLSGGERQRLGLAVALVGRPDVLILDEPTAGMDPEARATVRSLVTELRAGGAAILLTSHELPDVERLADRIIVLVNGRIAASGTPSDLAAGGRPRVRLRLDRPLDTAELGGFSRAIGVNIVLDGERYIVDGERPDPALVANIAAWCASAGRLIIELRTSGGSLEDAYLELVAAEVAP
jgi:ABC-2 type transport system ATP-binding protein